MKRAAELVRACLDFLFPKSAEETAAERIRLEDLALPSCRALPLPDSFLFAPLSYGAPAVKALVWSLKYHGSTHAASLLAEVLADSLMEELAERRRFSGFEAPVLIPLPLSRARKKERGFNQCELLGTELTRRIDGLAMETKLFEKIKDTPPQTKLEGREARRENLRGCFHVALPSEVAGRNILLLDDVITTGSTMREARSALLHAGAREVFCIGVAH
jgi:ComF family protein